MKGGDITAVLVKQIITILLLLSNRIPVRLKYIQEYLNKNRIEKNHDNENILL